MLGHLYVPIIKKKTDVVLFGHRNGGGQTILL